MRQGSFGVFEEEQVVQEWLLRNGREAGGDEGRGHAELCRL